MCDICRDTLKDFDIEHTSKNCPLRNAQYCSFCAKYGHLTHSCPAKPLKMYTEPIYLEQLIPYSDLKEYNITSNTPIHCVPLQESPREILEIKDNDKAISSYLAAQSIKVTKGSNKRNTLEEYAQLNNKRLVYIK